MSASSETPPLSQQPESRGALTGIAFKVASVCVFLAMAACIKASDEVPAGQLVFFRSFFALLPVLVYLGVTGALASGFKTQHPLSHVLRGLVGTGGMMFGFFALTKLPLPEATTINYATPLIIVVFSAVFLHEKVRLYRWSAVLVGLIGVLIIVSPQLTVFTSGTGLTDTALGTASALLGCVFAATAMLLVRRLVATESSATIVLYFSLASTCAGLLTIPFGWVMPSTEQLVLLVSAGIAGGIAQILLTESYRHADMSVIAPFEYASLILSVGVGYIFFGDIPTIQMLIGGLIVVGSGIFIIYREHRLGVANAKAQSSNTPQ